MSSDDTMSPLPSAKSTLAPVPPPVVPTATNKMLLAPAWGLLGDRGRKPTPTHPRSSTSQEPYDVFFLIYGATMVFFM